MTMPRDRPPHDHEERARKIDERIAALFQRLPMLHGFSVRSDLSTAEVWLHATPGRSLGAAVTEVVGRVLQKIVDERPEDAELLRGRTFARVMH